MEQPVFTGLSTCNSVDEICDRLIAIGEEYDIETVHITQEDNYIAYYGVRITEHKKEIPEGMKLIKGKETYTQREQFARRVDLCKYLDEYKNEKEKREKINKDKEKEIFDNKIQDAIADFVGK